MPFDFQQLANFRLARGSHKQPNKGGNICVNEAAVIAAGFQYREIKDVSCLPDCFSRPVSEYAIYLNDFKMHRVRNELLGPFVTRLPGTSDAPWIEAERARLIVVETVRRIVAAEYDEVWGKPTLAAKCRPVQLFEQVSPALAKAQAVLPLECAKQALKGLRGCLHPDLRVGSPCAAAAQAAETTTYLVPMPRKPPTERTAKGNFSLGVTIRSSIVPTVSLASLTTVLPTTLDVR